MLAARMYGAGDIRLEEMPVPAIGEQELLLKIKAAAICGTDVRMFTNGAAGIDPEHPRVLGHEIAGVIEAVGAGVTGYHKGRRVAVAPNMGCGICDCCVRGDGHLCPTYKALGINLDGGFAEYCVIPEAAVRGGNVTVLDDEVSFEEAAVNEPLSCVCNGFERAAIRPGDFVLVFGAGPIGILHLALARMAGAGKVMVSDPIDARLQAVKALYPDVITLQGDVAEEIRRITGGHGCDVVITACPVPAVQTQALELAALEGRVIFFGGVPASKQPVPLDTNLIHYKQLLVSGTTRASLAQYRKTLGFIASGVLDVKPLVTARLPLSAIADGLAMAQRGEGIKTVIVME